MPIVFKEKNFSIFKENTPFESDDEDDRDVPQKTREKPPEPIKQSLPARKTIKRENAVKKIIEVEPKPIVTEKVKPAEQQR